MKKVWILAAIAACLGVTQVRAEDAEPKAPSPKQVSQEMAQAWCGKMEECDPKKEMPVKECQKILFGSFKKGYERLPKEKPLVVERSTLDQCKESIGNGTCDSLKGAKSLAGCEFISLLGQ